MILYYSVDLLTFANEFLAVYNFTFTQKMLVLLSLAIVIDKPYNHLYTV